MALQLQRHIHFGMTCIDDIVDAASEATRVLYKGYHNRVTDDDGKAHLYFRQGLEVHKGFRLHLVSGIWGLGFVIRDTVQTVQDRIPR